MIAPKSQTIKFALRLAAIMTVMAIFFALSLFYGLEINSPLWLWLIFGFVFFLFSFWVIKYYTERLIYRQIKKIYKDVQGLEDAKIDQSPVTMDLNVLTQEVERFTENRQLELTTLKDREAYRREFMGNVAHELKTPLFTVQGYVLTLLDGAMKDKSVRKKYLQRANKAVERLIYIVKDLDMITKIEMGGLTLDQESFNIIELVQNAFDLLEMKAEKKEISLVFDRDYQDSIMVNADRERIQQVLTNLVDNSIKYGKQSGTTEVAINQLSEDRCLVRITDNGEGIEQEHMGRLFERFYRVDKSGSRAVGGSGLGLAIVKHLIEAHGEKIYVESQFGVGSEFSFTLEYTKQ
ncbi:MAG: sensor histidine kinase [Flavobacteriaceae bacterium]|jgi:two-component system phosphate regulon sensor histidine kinase PhoR|nr:sensor histidine kinase [Flavobacteriaceae bacterium]